ncbi:CapA family protein [Marinicrinis sediminis]|uniref:CapA family protein n=1 Tax=Marinicrinis sediminis TaxID=1652465 RepID=A0ABW5R8Z1_9BACL
MQSRQERHQAVKERRKTRQRKQIRWFTIVLTSFIILLTTVLAWQWLDGNKDDNQVSSSPPSTSTDQEQGENSPSDPSETPDSQETEAEAAETEESEVGESEESEPGEPETPANNQQGVSSDHTRVTLKFVGDIMFAGKVEPIVEEKGYDYPFSQVKAQLAEADILAGNLETPLSTRGEPADKAYAYRSSPKAVEALSEAGFDILNTANNHILDYGWDAFHDTHRYLKEGGLQAIGSGANEEEAYQPVVIERNGIRVAYLGFSQVVPNGDWKARGDEPGVASTYDYRLPVAAIERAEQEADLVVVIAHWGVEREEQPEDRQIEMAHRYIDAGADLVVASHAHVLQGFEQYKGKWIAYNIGNFVFTTNDNSKTWETLILEASCTADADCSLSMEPVLTKFARPIVMTEPARSGLLERIDALSRPLGTRVQADGSLTAETGEEN